MRFLVLLVLAMAAAPAGSEFAPSAKRMRADISYLADDTLEGREAGTAGYNKAAAYVAEQFEAIGLAPAGDPGNGYFQNVPLLSAKSFNHGAMVIRRGTHAARLSFGEDYLPSVSFETPRLEIEAAIVFAAHGIVAPQRHLDDYEGLDVAGKIVAVAAGAPAFLDSEERAHLGGSGTKAEEAAKRGAAGILFLTTPDRQQRRSYAARRKHWDDERMSWAAPDGGPGRGAGVPSLGILSLKGTRRLLELAPMDRKDIFENLEARGDERPRFALPATLRVRLDSVITRTKSSNVAGLLPGGDPKLADEVVILSAHLDGVGRVAEENGDDIGNGAMDNASGIAVMLEVARGLASGQPPRRPVLLLAVTAEEKGLIGADYFARHPTIAPRKMTANVNLDMPILTYPFTDLVAFGAERSTIGPLVKQAAESRGLTLTADPQPERGIFTRSDHYRFVQQGVPSIFVWPGFAADGDKAAESFFENAYHGPADDMNLPFDWNAFERFAALNLEITRTIANAEEAPHWHEGDFFGTLYSKSSTEVGPDGR